MVAPGRSILGKAALPAAIPGQLQLSKDVESIPAGLEPLHQESLISCSVSDVNLKYINMMT